MLEAGANFSSFAVIVSGVLTGESVLQATPHSSEALPKVFSSVLECFTGAVEGARYGLFGSGRAADQHPTQYNDHDQPGVHHASSRHSQATPAPRQRAGT